MDQNKSKSPQPKKKKTLHFFPQSKHFLHGTKNQKEKFWKIIETEKKKHFQALFFRKKMYTWTRNSRKQTFYSAEYDGNGNGMGIGFSANQMLCVYHTYRERERERRGTS